MAIDFSSFKKALTSLERALKRAGENPSDEELRDATIQRFEYTYELCWKMLKRTLAQEAATPADIEHLSFKELIRAGAEHDLLADADKWFTYRELRNLTSHVYDQLIAKEVYQEVASFYKDAH